MNKNSRIHKSDLMSESALNEAVMPHYSPSKVQIGDEIGYVMVNTHGYVMPPEMFQDFMEKATRAYGAEGMKDEIDFHNFKKEYPLFLTQEVDGKFVLPAPVIHKIGFRNDLKKDWSFTCSWCEDKVSSKGNEFYYEVDKHLDDIGLTWIQGRFCQEACAEHYWYEQAIDLIKEKNVEKHIHTDKRVGKETR